MTPSIEGEGLEPALRVDNITKRFGGVKALDSVSLELFPGEVHCLAGENGSGKSTLIKIISGAEFPDSGEITIGDKTHTHMDATAAIKMGVQVIYQDFSLFPNLSVSENITLTSAVANRRKRYSRTASLPAAAAIVEELGLTLDLHKRVEDLSVADKQLTAICRALVNDASVIIMDEPTTALTHHEVERLFQLVERLQHRGVALMFVSHKLDEVLAISQRVTILRSGRRVTTGPASGFDQRSISRHMTGRDIIESRQVSALDNQAESILSVNNLTLPGAYDDVSFTLKRSEILGVTGLLGSGRTEIAESLFGVMPARSGSIQIDGQEIEISSIDDAVEAGIGYVPEDRLSQGLFLDKSIADNIIASSIDNHRTRWRTLDTAQIRHSIKTLFERLKIKAPNTEAPVRSLSGGNAQRVVLAKWLATRPKILILNGPTVGVDVGSKEEILDLLRQEAKDGMSIMVISDDAPELVSCCHRVLIIRQGKIVHELAGDSLTVETVQERMAA